MNEEKSFPKTSINWFPGHINEKHFQYLINKGINMDFFLQMYNDFYLKKLIFMVVET